MSISTELVRIALSAYGSGDIEIAMELCDPHVRWDERAVRPGAELIWGREEVLLQMRRYQRGWQDYGYELEKLKDFVPGHVVGLYCEYGDDEAGLPVNRRLGGLWVVEAQLITSWTAYLTAKEAVSAARGLATARLEKTGGPKQAKQAGP